jgi:N-acetylglucosamine-6-phosphate deacetylase
MSAATAYGETVTGPGQGNLTALLGQILHGGKTVPATVIWTGAQITELAIGRHVRPGGAGVYEFADGLIVPGLIDLHVHGGGGYAWQDGPAAIAAAARWLAANGTTGFLASLPALAWPRLTAAVHDLAAACASGQPPNLLGLHLEGPFLSPRRAGSIGTAHLRGPSLADYCALRAVAGQSLKVLTLAPELHGAADVLAACARDDVVAAAGHTDGSYEEVAAGFGRGVGHVTHLFNAMRPFHHRAPGAVGAALLAPAPVCAELILDGLHVEAGAWRLARQALGPDRIVYVSDALPAAGRAGDGVWLDQPVRRTGRRLTLADGTIAGSDISLREAVRQAIRWGAPAAEAVASATLVPAGVLGLAQRKGRLLPGYDADIAVFGPDWQPYLTIRGGQRIWPTGAPAVTGRRSIATP